MNAITGQGIKGHGIKNVPGALYDLSGRISAARAVASCALEALPGGLTELEYIRMNHAGNLIAALEDILGLAAQDVDLVERQLQRGDETEKLKQGMEGAPPPA